MIVASLDSIKIGFASSRYLSSDKVVITSSKALGLISHFIHDEEVYDQPVKTQIALDVVVEDENVTENQIKDLLNSLYSNSISRTGFKHHKHPTNVFIYIYSSKAKATFLWLGWPSIEI